LSLAVKKLKFLYLAVFQSRTDHNSSPLYFQLLCYYNPYFRKDHPELLELCKRRVAQKRRAVAAPNPQEELNEGSPRSSPDAQPMEGTAAGPEKSLLTADPHQAYSHWHP